MIFRPNHYTKDKMLRFRRVGAASVAGVYFLTNVMAAHAVERSLWEERRAALNQASFDARLVSVPQSPRRWDPTLFDGGSTTSQPPSNYLKRAVPFDVASAVLPYGAIGEVQQGRPGAPVVFLVQDVHGNPGAQKNIGGLLGALSARGVALAGVEGAWGPLDLSAYHRHPSPKAVSLVADALLASGRLSGSEWAGLTAPSPPTLVGVESQNLYHANVTAARECVARRPAVASFLRSLDHVLQAQKERRYSPELKLFDRRQKDYHAGREGLADFSHYLSGLPGAEDRAGAQIKMFLQALEWESRLNFDRIEAERRRLMDRLAQDLDPKALESLLAQAMSYRAGKQTNADFFAYLKSLCVKAKIPLSSYPSFADSIAYVGLVQSIRRIELLNEFTAWETTVGNSLAKTPEEHRLLILDRDANLLRQLLENEMSPEAWGLFVQRRQEIVSLPHRLRAFGEIQESPESLSSLFFPHEEFCRLAMERNKVLVSNFMRQVESRKAIQAVLLTGGFHTPGLQSELKKRGCSTVVITPRIEKVEGKPLDVFARDPLPFDQLFAGKPISLSPELMMASLRTYLINLAVTAESIAEKNKVSDAVWKWANDQGIQVGESTYNNGVFKINLLFKGNAIVVTIGPPGNYGSSSDPGTLLCEPLSFSNGSILRMYANAHFEKGKNTKSLFGVLSWFFQGVLRYLFGDIENLRPYNFAGNVIRFLFFPYHMVNKLHILPESDLGRRLEVELVSAKKNNTFNITVKGRNVGTVSFIETGKAIILLSIKVSEKHRGYGLSSVLILAKQAAGISNPNMSENGGRMPFVVSEVENPKLFIMLRDRVFVPGTMEIVPARSGTVLRADTAWRNPIDESAGGFMSLTGNGNVDDKSGMYVTHFHIRGELRPEITNGSRASDLPPGGPRESAPQEGSLSGPQKKSINAPFISVDRSGPILKVTLTDPSGKTAGHAFVGGKRGAIDVSGLSIESGDNSFAKDLLSGVFKDFLLLKGQGRVLLRGVRDPRVKWAALSFFGETFQMAPKGFGRSLSNRPWEDVVESGSEKFVQLLNDPDVDVDMAGSLTQEARKSLWPNEDLPSLEGEQDVSISPPVVFVPSENEALKKKLSGYSGRESNLFEIWVGGRNVGDIVFYENGKKLIVKNIEIYQHFQSNGFGKSVYRALAKRATRILSSEQNANGIPVPFEGRCIKNPAVLNISRALYKPGTIEIVPLGTKHETDEDDLNFNWTDAVKEGTREFERLAGESNVGGDGNYRVLFHLRGELGQDLYDEAARDTLREQRMANPLPVVRDVSPSHGFVLIGVGVPFDPLIGLTIATLLIAAMFFKPKILKGLEGRAPPQVCQFLTRWIPSLHFPWKTVSGFLNRFVNRTFPSYAKKYFTRTHFRSLRTGAHFDVSRDSLGVTLKMLDHQGRLIGSLVLLGLRGEVTLTNIKIDSASQENVFMLLEEAARISLFKRGAGRIFIPRVGDKKILKAAMDLFDLPSLFVARTRFDRSIKNVRQSAGVRTENKEEVLRLLETTSQTVDVCGSISPALIRERVNDNEGAVFPQRQLPFVKLIKNEFRGFDDFRIIAGMDIVGSMIVKVLADVIIILKIEVKTEPQNHRRKGYGSAAIMHFAEMASRILYPRQNLSGISLPLEMRNIINPWIYQHAIQNLFEEGTVELAEVGTGWALYEEIQPSDWTQAVRPGDARYKFLISQENINGTGDYLSRFHLRGQLRRSVNLSAENGYMNNTPLNGLLFISAGFPVDPLWGIFLALVVGVAFLNRAAIKKWLSSTDAFKSLKKWCPNLFSFGSAWSRLSEPFIGEEESGIKKTFRRLFPFLYSNKFIVPPSANRSPYSVREDLDDTELLESLDMGNIEDTYAFLARFFGLGGVAADVGSSSFEGPAKGLRRGGVSRVSLVDHLHRMTSELSPGILSVPGDATALSEFLGEEGMDAVVFHRSLHDIVVDEETRGSEFGRYLIDKGAGPDENELFHVDILSRVLEEARNSLKPGGRLLIYFAPDTFRLPGPPALFGWNLNEMLSEKGFQEVRVWQSPGGTVLLSGVRPMPQVVNPLIGGFQASGIQVRRRPLNDTLSLENRRAFGHALTSLLSRSFEMQGVEALVDPHRLVSKERSVDRLKELLDFNGASPWEVPGGLLEGVIQNDSESVLRMRLFAAQILGNKALASRIVMAAQSGDAASAGAALAAWDDSKFLAGPSPEIVGEILAELIAGQPEQSEVVMTKFARAYNHARSGLLFPKLMGGQWIGPKAAQPNAPGIVLNLSPLFDASASTVLKDQTWLALASALTPLERDPNAPLALVVFGERNNRKKVEEILSRGLPKVAAEILKSNLIVEDETSATKFFKEGKFLLSVLQQRPQWQKDVKALGFTEETLLSGEAYSIQWIPLDVPLNPDLLRIVNLLKFIRLNA